MKALVTGARGTIGSVLCSLLKQNDFEVESWNRQWIPIDDYRRMEDFILEIHPDVLFHLAYTSQHHNSYESWKVNVEWPAELAWITHKLNIRFLFTSTNLVFSNQQQDPFSTDSVPDAVSGYGYEKRKAEERVLYQNPDAAIARLGWQIGTAPGSNNMIDYLQRQMNESGIVKANVNWKPACSFLPDTCTQLIDLMMNHPPSLYQLDSNARWNFFEIATALNDLHANRWIIEAVSGKVLDNRMPDARLHMPLLDLHLDLH